MMPGSEFCMARTGCQAKVSKLEQNQMKILQLDYWHSPVNVMVCLKNTVYVQSQPVDERS
jgi:hypothetical protein